MCAAYTDAQLEFLLAALENLPGDFRVYLLALISDSVAAGLNPAEVTIQNLTAGSVLVDVRASFHSQPSAVAFRERLMCCTVELFEESPFFRELGPVQTLWASTSFNGVGKSGNNLLPWELGLDMHANEATYFQTSL